MDDENYRQVVDGASDAIVVDGAPSGIAAIIRDVTERWHENRALRRRLRELEDELIRRRQAGGPASSP